MRRNAAANRERILVAAEAVFGEHGDAGSTEDVARRAEVGIATVFRHFPTKDALVEAALLRHFAELDTLAAALAARPEPGAAFVELVRRMIETGATKLTLVSLLTDTFPPGLRTAAESLRARVEDLLGRAQEAGAIRADATVDEVYLLIRALAHAGVTQPTPPATLARAVDVVLAGLRA